MNAEWALAELDKFIAQTAMSNASSANVITSRDRTTAPDVEVTKQAPVIEKILDGVIPNWHTEVPDTSANNRWSRHREGAIRAREELAREQEIKQNLGENAPELSATQLHPWIWSGASSLWQSSHYHEAVGGAIRKLNAETQNKLGRRDVSETDLFKQAFTLAAPVPGKSRLRRMAVDRSKTYESIQRGAMALAEGVFAGIRNPISHEVDQELTEQEALEYLAVLSVLARWVDESEVEAAS